MTMYGRFKDHLAKELQQIRDRGLFKKERVLTTPQGVEIRTESGVKILNFCANNYLGLCNELRVMAAANYAFFRWGFGMASVRFICGTHEHCGVMDKVDIVVTTFGKALGGASGGCVAGRQEIIDLLRQRSRPYLFSNSLDFIIRSSRWGNRGSEFRSARRIRPSRARSSLKYSTKP